MALRIPTAFKIYPNLDFWLENMYTIWQHWPGIVRGISLNGSPNLILVAPTSFSAGCGEKVETAKNTFFPEKGGGIVLPLATQKFSKVHFKKLQQRFCVLKPM
jgi:hypothetical protein